MVEWIGGEVFMGQVEMRIVAYDRSLFNFIHCEKVHCSNAVLLIRNENSFMIHVGLTFVEFLHSRYQP